MNDPDRQFPDHAQFESQLLAASGETQRQTSTDVPHTDADAHDQQTDDPFTLRPTNETVTCSVPEGGGTAANIATFRDRAAHTVSGLHNSSDVSHRIVSGTTRGPGDEWIRMAPGVDVPLAD
jgi:hypothetical protein